jgi:predicted transcriptional regulator
MLTLPEDWEFTTQHLSEISRDSVDTVRTAVRELEKSGYITRERTRDEHGKYIGIEYVIHETPVIEN